MFSYVALACAEPGVRVEFGRDIRSFPGIVFGGV